MDFKVENKIKKYRRLLDISGKELGAGNISEDTIYNIENGRGSVSLVTTLLIIIRINKFVEKAGILLNLSLKDILMSEEEVLIEYCKGKLNELSKSTFNEKLYLDLLEFTKSCNNKVCEGLVTLEIGLRFIDIDPKKALIYFESLYEDYEDKGKLLRYKAKAEVKLNNYEGAISLLKKAKSYIKEEALLERINCDIGTFLSIIREDLEAKEVFEEVLKTNIVDKGIEIISKFNYAVVCTNLKEYEKALNIYNELLKRDDENKAGIYYNISGLYNMMEDDEKSYLYLNKLIEHEASKKSEFTLHGLFNLAARYRDNGMFKEAIVLFENSIKASKEYKKYSKGLRGYKEILKILKLQNRKNEFTQYLSSILRDIDFYKDTEDTKEVLTILVEFLKDDSNEIIHEIINKLQGDVK